MKFASKIVALCAVMAVLGAALLLGDIFSPQRVQARTTGRPLLGALSPKSIEGMDIVYKGTSLASLRLTTAGWEATSGSRTYPASVEILERGLLDIGIEIGNANQALVRRIHILAVDLELLVGLFARIAG